MSLKILSGSANPALAESLARNAEVRLVERTLERFPDGELHIEIHESVRGHDVYIVQPTCPPVDEHLFELLLLADACRRAGASQLTAVIPYFGYARQDRRSRGREPLSIRVVADLIRASGLERVIAVDLHSYAVESAFAIPVEHLSAVPILAEDERSVAQKSSVIVSPDLGAVKLAERYARLLDLPVAIIQKSRISGRDVTVRRVIGDVRDKEILLIDDMISTGATIEKALQALLEAGCSPAGVKVLASHALLVGDAGERLAKLPIETIYVSDSVPTLDHFPVRLKVLSLAALLAETIQRLHFQQSLREFRARE